jgi:DNA-binding CsgD family transcriptional regulator
MRPASRRRPSRWRWPSCRERAAEAIALGEARDNCHPVSAASAALGVLELGLGRPAEALTRLQSVFVDGHMTYRYTVVDDLIEAAVRAGRPDDALDPLAAWQRWVQHSGLVIGDIVIARARAFLAHPEDADERFREALDAHERVPWPFVHARTELAYGEFLRRARRKTEARVQLRSALERFEALDAAPWADRAAAELRATGETARKRDPSTLAQLTPQELQIARLVAEGGRNREVAARLFLSPKTVEYHLRKVFQKLDITSRGDLVRLFSGGQAPPELLAAAP